MAEFMANLCIIKNWLSLWLISGTPMASQWQMNGILKHSFSTNYHY
jgi:hypothetical protein